jgi:hypothetical protein
VLAPTEGLGGAALVGEVLHLYGYLRIHCCKRLHALAPLSRKRPPGPGDYSVTTALATQVYFISNKV